MTESTSETMSDTPLAGAIKGVAVLDLTALTSVEDLARITSIEGVALVLVPQSLAGAFAAIPQSGVASVVPVADGTTPQVHTGALTMPGEGLASPDVADKVLIVTGSLILTTPVEKVTYNQIIITGAVLAPTGSEAALAAGLTRVTGGVEYFRYAEGQRIHLVSGQTRLGADTLANEGGSPDDVLVLAGQIIIMPGVRTVGFQRVIAAGQIVAPLAAEQVLAPTLTIHGQVAWYDGRPRFFIGADRFGRDFFEALDEPIALGLVGGFTIEDDVTPEMVRAAVSDIVLVGALKAPKSLVGTLQVLTTEKHGTIRATEGDGGS